MGKAGFLLVNIEILICSLFFEKCKKEVVNLQTKAVKENSFDFDRVESLLQEFVDKKGVVVPILQKIQHEFGYLPRPALEYMAKRLRIPVSRVYGVATFYAQLPPANEE